MQKVLSTFILLGALQGLIITALLFFSKLNQKPNRILALLILLISLASLHLYGNYANWFGSYLHLFQVIPTIFVMPIGPLIWLYVQALLNPQFTILPKHRRHFYPVLIDLVPSLSIMLYIIGTATNLVAKKPGPWTHFLDYYNVYADIPRWLSVSWYVWLSIKYFSGIAVANENNLKWLRQFTRAFMVFQGIWLLYLVPYVIPKYTVFMLDTFDWYPVYVPMAILIYWLGIKGYTISFHQTVKNKAAYLTADQIDPVVAALTKAMEDKAFLNPHLDLSSMARITNFPAKTISAVLNQHVKTSFNAFVNGYRVEEFKNKLALPGWQHLKISALAAECGFSSLATFQRSFKEIAGISPSEYLKLVASTTQIGI